MCNKGKEGRKDMERDMMIKLIQDRSSFINELRIRIKMMDDRCRGCLRLCIYGYNQGEVYGE